MFSLTAIFINVVVAALHVPEGYEGAINVFLIILNVLVLAIIAGNVNNICYSLSNVYANETMYNIFFYIILHRYINNNANGTSLP